MVGAGIWGKVGADRREFRVRGAEDVLVGGGAALVLFDARVEVPSAFLFPVGVGSRGGGSEECTADGEAGVMGTLFMAMSSPPTAVGGGREPVAGLEM